MRPSAADPRTPLAKKSLTGVFFICASTLAVSWLPAARTAFRYWMVARIVAAWIDG